MIVSTGLPYDAARFKEADALLACYLPVGMEELPMYVDDDGELIYSDHVPAYGAGIPAAIYTILGGNAPTGRLPVDIPELDADYHYSDEIAFERGFGLSYDPGP